jgi:hypothetical protein
MVLDIVKALAKRALWNRDNRLVERRTWPTRRVDASAFVATINRIILVR